MYGGRGKWGQERRKEQGRGGGVNGRARERDVGTCGGVTEGKGKGRESKGGDIEVGKLILS